MQSQNAKNIRNLAIVAHIDHGKTTLIDSIFRAAQTFAAHTQVAERVMDNNPLERERGITILAVLHDLNRALSFGDRFFFLKDGTVFRSGGRETITPENVRLSFGAEIRLVESEGRTYIIQEALK